MGRRAAGRRGDLVGGRRNGREPVGEAWLEEGVMVNGMEVMRRAVCVWRGNVSWCALG